MTNQTDKTINEYHEYKKMIAWLKERGEPIITKTLAGDISIYEELLLETKSLLFVQSALGLLTLPLAVVLATSEGA